MTENAELKQQLMRKEAELTEAVKTARREQQQVREIQYTCSHVNAGPPELGGGGGAGVAKAAPPFVSHASTKN